MDEKVRSLAHSWAVGGALMGVFLVPRIHYAVFGPVTSADRQKVTSELRGMLLQAAVALIVFREPVGWRALLALFPSVVLRYLHSMIGIRLDDPATLRSRHKLGALLGALHVADMVWAHYWFSRVIAYEGWRPLTVAFFADIVVLWGQLVMYTGHYLWPKNRISRSIVTIYSYLLRLFIYLSLAGLMATHWYLPIHILRDAYITLKLALANLSEAISYRRAFRRYGITSTPLDSLLECPICHETDQDAMFVSTSCGHVMHLRCLHPWLNINPVCPICRSQQDEKPSPRPESDAH